MASPVSGNGLGAAPERFINTGWKSRAADPGFASMDRSATRGSTPLAPAEASVGADLSRFDTIPRIGATPRTVPA